MIPREPGTLPEIWEVHTKWHEVMNDTQRARKEMGGKKKGRKKEGKKKKKPECAAACVLENCLERGRAASQGLHALLTPTPLPPPQSTPHTHHFHRMASDTSLLQSTPSFPSILPHASHLRRNSQFRLPPVAASASDASSITLQSAEEKTTLGASNVEVTKLGIGAWSWGDTFFWNDGSWDDRKMKAAREAFNASVDAGITFFDTAEVYGSKMFGGGEDSESLLGRFIRERKKVDGKEIIVATKFAALPWRFGSGSVICTLKESLRRLGLSYVDLYQLHWPGIWGNEAYIDGLADAVEQGLVKAVGVSNYNEQRLRSAHAQLKKSGIPLASNQVHYSLLYRVPENNGVKEACKELGVALIAYSPIAQGILSGKYTPDNPPSGPRGQIYNKEFLQKASPLLQVLREIGERYGKTPTQVSLNWLLAQGDVIPIPGAKTAAQAQEFAGALGWSLTVEEVEELRKLATKVGSFRGFPAESL